MCIADEDGDNADDRDDENDKGEEQSNEDEDDDNDQTDKNSNKNQDSNNNNNRNAASKVTVQKATNVGVPKASSRVIEDDEASDVDDRRRPLRMGHTFGMLPHPRIDKYGMSPLPLSHVDIVNLNDERQAWGLVSPPHSAVVYRVQDISNVFLALLILQVRAAAAAA